MSEVSISDFTELIREADRLFETVGGSTRHYVADCLLPLMEEKGMKLINTHPHPTVIEDWQTVLDKFLIRLMISKPERDAIIKILSKNK